MSTIAIVFHTYVCVMIYVCICQVAREEYGILDSCEGKKSGINIIKKKEKDFVINFYD